MPFCSWTVNTIEIQIKGSAKEKCIKYARKRSYAQVESEEVAEEENLKAQQNCKMNNQ